MILYGSDASPYVRRIRLLLHGKDFEFKKVSVFNAAQRKELLKLTPILKIPLLQDGDKIIYDSLLITRHLGFEIDIKTHQDLILINEANDAGIIYYQLKFMNLDPYYENQFSLNQKSRILNILDYFNENVPSTWNLSAQWLYCMLDWFDYREVIPWKEDFTNLLDFKEQNEERPEIIATAP